MEGEASSEGSEEGGVQTGMQQAFSEHPHWVLDASQRGEDKRRLRLALEG